MSRRIDQQPEWLPDDSPIATVLVILVCVAVSVGLVWWAGARDRNGIAEASESRATHPPLTLPELAPVAPGVGDWPVWPTEREVRFVARLHELAEALEAEVAVSSAVRPSAISPVIVTSGMDDWPWPQLRACESRGSGGWAANTGNGYYGAYQFHLPTWRGAVARAGLGEWADVLPSDAPPEVQHAAAVQLHSERGFQPWPGCRRRLGLS